jgi:hypothetical protein
MQSNIHTPAATRPRFQCSQCVHQFYNRAGLKNHVRAKHGSQETSSQTSQMSSPVSDHPPSPHYSDSEGEPLHDQEFPGPSPPLFPSDDVPMDVDSEPPFSNYYDEDDDYGYNCDDNTDVYDHDLGCSSPPIIPSSPQHESRSHGHQQIPANDNFLWRVYHNKLNGEFLMYFCHLRF